MVSSSCSTIELIFLLVFLSLWSCLLSFPNYVSSLPGFNGTLPSHLETGYVTVDKAKGTEFFYYFVESEREPSNDPVLIWLTGGPGCSSFYGFSQETGPIRFKVMSYDGTLPDLVYNPYTWTKISSIIFLDWPSGGGFSYSKRNAANHVFDDPSSLNQIYNFLQQWFLDHPQFLSNPFYVAGDSFGGKMAALVAHRVAKGIEAAEQPSINLEGLLIGNPRTGINKFDIKPQVSQAHAFGIISDELLESIERNCEGDDYFNPKRSPCVAKLKIFQEYIDEIAPDNILMPKCLTKTIRGKQMRGKMWSLLEENFTEQLQQQESPDIKCSDYTISLANYWANNNFTRKMLRVKEETVGEWKMCNTSLKEHYSETVINSSLPYIYDLINYGHRVLVYSGTHDTLIPSIGTIEWIKSFNLPIVSNWRSWRVNGQVAGYTEAYSLNLTFASVMGAGHEAVRDNPRQCWAMFERWIANKPL